MLSPDVEWVRFDIEKLLFTQQAALMVLQGWPLMKFFEDVSFSSPLNASQYNPGMYSGTFVFLRGDLSELADPPLTLSNIVLAKIIKLKEGMTRDEILGTLLQEVLPARFP